MIPRQQIRLLVYLTLCLVFSGCRAAESTVEKAKPVRPAVSAVAVAPEHVRLKVGQSLLLTVTLGDASGNILARKKFGARFAADSEVNEMTVVSDSRGRGGRIVSWSSSHPDLVSVDMRGQISALDVGTVEITAESEGCRSSVSVTVDKQISDRFNLAPVAGSISVGDSVQMVISHSEGGKGKTVHWRTDQPELLKIDQSGYVTAIAPGNATIVVSDGQNESRSDFVIKPVEQISGLDFPGNAGVEETMRFEFTQPFKAVPVTYIWRVYPRQQESYYTAFFWGNNGAFYPTRTYLGFHPYPDWDTASQQFWEIAAPPGSDNVSKEHVVFDRWYTQVAICRSGNEMIRCEYYWDWPETDRVIRYEKEPFVDPPDPVLVVGDAPLESG